MGFTKVVGSEHISDKTPVTKSPLRRSIYRALCSVVMAGLGLSSVGYAANPSVGYAEYFVLGDEADLLTALQNVPGPTVAGPIHSVLSIVSSADDCHVYIDWHENGYNFDPNNAAATADAKWDTAVGGANDRGPALAEGGVLTLTETDTLAGGPDGVDGGDRIYVTGSPVSVVRTMWADSPGTAMSGNFPLYPVQYWQSSYTVPVGEDVPGILNSPFGTTFLFVEAQYANTRVIVTDPVGGQVLNTVLGAGQNTMVPVAADGIRAGTTVVATEDGTANPRPIQAGIVTGVNNALNNTRYYTLTPDSFLGSEYYLPVPSMREGATLRETRVYVYATANATPVEFETAAGTSNILLNAGQVARFDMPRNENTDLVTNPQGFYGAVARSSDPAKKIGVLVAGDDERAVTDFGYQALPTEFLASNYYVPRGPANPINVTPINDNTQFFVDFNNDGSVDQQFELDRLETRMIYPPAPGFDATGAHIYSSDAAVVVWAQDNTESSNATETSGGTDQGYTVLPLLWFEPKLAIDKEANPDFIGQTGAVVDFSLFAKSFDDPMFNLDILDTLPAGWQYVANSATVSYTDGTPSAQVEPSIVGQDLSWALDKDLAADEGVTVTFSAITPNSVSPGVVFNRGEAYATQISSELNANAFLFRPVDLAAVTVSNVLAVDDAYSTDEDTNLVVNSANGVLDNDGPGTAQKLTDPSNGTLVSFLADGSFTYDPDSNFHGTDSFTYQVNNGGDVSQVVTVTITVNPVNDNPVANHDGPIGGFEDTSLVVDVLTNDTDADGDSLTPSLCPGSAVNGTAVLNQDGTFTFTPNPNYYGPAFFEYQVTDGTGNSGCAMVNMTFASVEDTPVAVPDSVTTPEDTAVNIDPRVNDYDNDNDPITAVIVDYPSHGTLVPSGAEFTYTPNLNYNGPDSFTYYVTDGNGDSATVTVSINVTPVNDAPNAANDTYVTGEHQELNVPLVLGVIANDVDVDGDPLVAKLVGTPVHGFVVLNTNGTFTYTPDDNYNGPDTFQYEIRDPAGLASVGTVTIHVGLNNDAPVAQDDVYEVLEDATLSVETSGVLMNDFDVDFDVTTASLVTYPVHGTLTFNEDGSFEYEPFANYHGPDSFKYQAHDNWLMSNVATVTITVTAANDGPVANDDAYTTDEDTPLTIPAPGVFGNDTDLDGNELSLTLTSAPSSGSVTLNPDGSFTYNPIADFTGSVTFSYSVSDGTATDSATVTIVVVGINDAPVAVDDQYVTAEDTPLVLTNVTGVRANDTDADHALNQLSVTLVTNPVHGTITGLSANGSLTYTPHANYHGPDSFTYRLNDTAGGISNVATVSISVIAANDAPVGTHDAYSVAEDHVLTVPAPGVLSNDSDADGQALSAVLLSSTTSGSLTLNSNGSFVYTPVANFHGVDSFTYRATDGTSESVTLTVNLTVTPVNDAPVAVNDSYVTGEHTVLTVNGLLGVLANDSDVDGVNFTVVKVSDPVHGTLAGPNNNGAFTYTPNGLFSGTDSFAYRIVDALGASSNIATVTITVNKVNDAPVAVDDATSTSEDQAITVAAPGVLVNDTDEDGDTLSAVLVSNPTSGTVTLNANGGYTYTPSANFAGTDQFSYRASDGALQSGVATVVITVNPVNDVPVAANDSYIVNEDETLVVPVAGVLANDSDVDGDTLEAVLVDNVLHGVLSLNAAGNFEYTPAPGYHGTDSFTYRAFDGSASSALATVTITVGAVNDAPIANQDEYSTPENTQISVPAKGVLTNDFDLDGDILTAVLVDNPASGTLALDSDGSFVYTPNSGIHGADLFTYIATDGTSESVVTTVTLNVGPVNDTPVSADDSYSVEEDGSLNIGAPGVLLNDTDGDGDSLQAQLLLGPQNAASFTLNPNGSFSYEPADDFHGTDTFFYQANDGVSQSGVTMVTITVTPTNDAPAAQNNIYMTTEDSPLVVAAPGILGNDQDVDGDNLTAILSTNPFRGTVQLSADGSFIYTPNVDIPGQNQFPVFDTFTYRANDGARNSNLASVGIMIFPVNDAPVAVDDAYSTDEDTPLTVLAADGLRLNDSDVDNEIADLTVTILSGPSHGTLSGPGLANGRFTYTPDANWTGVDTFTYRLSDPSGAQSNTATVSITVNAANDAPVAFDDVYTTVEDGPLTVAATGILANDQDNDGDTLTALLISNPTSGTVALNGNGGFAYTPNANFNGIDSFTYQADDGTSVSNQATVTINVTAVNDVPVVANDAYLTEEDTVLTVATPGVLGNDSDVDSTSLEAVLVDNVLHGTLALDSNGSFVYTPAPGYHGTDSFTYRAFDGTGNSALATVVITVGSANDAPVANEDAYSTPENTPLAVGAPGILTNDFDLDGDILSAVLVDNPASGTLVLDSDGSFVYTPNSGINGADLFTYIATDGTSESVVTTVTLNVGPVNDLPVSADDSYSVEEDGALNIDAPGVLLNDTDGDGDSLQAQLLLGPQHADSFTLNGDGSFSYEPAADFHGTDTFFYQATDGVSQSGVTMVTITVTPTNDAPEASDNLFATPEDTQLMVAAPGILANDSDPDGDAISAVLVTNPQRGTLVLNADGSFLYTPNADVPNQNLFPVTDTFAYRAHDGTENSNLATVTIVITPVNDAPVAVDDAYSTDEDTPLTVSVPNGLRLNDSDVDNSNAVLTVTILSGPSHGALSGMGISAGGFTYTPDANWAGVDTFTYRLSDPSGAQSNTATVSITVNAENDAPVAVNNVYSTVEDVPFTVVAPGILSNDQDNDGDALTALLVANVTNGALTLNGNGGFTYTPNANFNGSDSFTYRADDGTTYSNVARVVINVDEVNDAPVAVEDSYVAEEETLLSVPAAGVLNNDSDVEGDDLEATLVNGPQHASSFTLYADGSFVYTGATGFSGTDSFTYRAFDGAANSEITKVTIRVAAVNDAPVANEDLYSTLEEMPLTVAAPGVLANDVDQDQDALTALLVDNVASGTLALDGNGGFTYVPATGFNGTDRFTYRAFDGTSESLVTTVTITVGIENDVPVALNDNYVVAEDTELSVGVAGVLNNDTDEDEDELLAVLVNGPQHASAFTLNSDGSFTYTGAENYTGTDTFTYQATDGVSNSNVATVTITVTPSNDGPEPGDDEFTTLEDHPLVVPAPGVLVNDSDVEGDVLSAVLQDNPSSGSVVLQADGSFVYTPMADFFGQDSFTYHVSDGTNEPVLATVTINVTPLNDVPVALDDEYTVDEDGSLSIPTPGILANDADADGDTLTPQVVMPPLYATTFTINTDGSFHYVPQANFSGTDSFTYQAFDGTAQSEVATVTINVVPANDAPIGTEDSFQLTEDVPLTVAAPGVLDNDSDGDGDALTAVLLTAPEHGTLALNANGGFTYTPDANYAGTDEFFYRAHDGGLSSEATTVSLTIVPVNDAPQATADTYVTNEETELSVDAPGVLGNDTDVDGPSLEAQLITAPLHANSFTLNGDGSFTYTPEDGFSGTDTFVYRASDSLALSEPVTVTITVVPVNDEPVAIGDAFSTAEDTVLNVAAPGVLVNDTDADGDALSAVLIDGTSNGTIALNANGSFVYTPNANFAGTDTFTYTAFDGSLHSEVVSVEIEVTEVNDAPVAVDNSYVVDEDTTLTVAAPGVLLNDLDPEGTETLSAMVVVPPVHGTVTLDADGGFRYSPHPNFFGTDSFGYQAFDGSATSNVAAVIIEVLPVNDAPVANDDEYSTNEETPLTVAATGVLANDQDADGDTLTALLVNAPVNGTLTLNGNGGFTYTPETGFNGAETFTYRADDGTSVSNLATVTINVVVDNDAPVAVDDLYVTDEDTDLTIDAPGILSNDTDEDGNPLEVKRVVTQPLFGTVTVQADGSFVYSPNTDFTGTDRFLYQANDGFADSNVATVTIQVGAVNDPPEAVEDAFSTAEDVPLVVAAPGVLVNDTDPDGDSLTAVLTNGPTNGTVALNGDGSFTYTPNLQFHGIDRFTYQAFDGFLNSEVTTVTLTVGAANDAPVAKNDTYTTPEDTQLTIDPPGVLLNDTDEDGDALEAVIFSNPVNGTVTLNDNGGFVYTPNEHFNGEDSFCYRAFDGTRYSAPAKVTIIVTPVNDPPVAFEDAFSTPEDMPLVVAAQGVLVNDVDYDGDTLIAILVDNAQNGTVALNGTGAFVYTPNPNYSGPDTFTYKAFDGVYNSGVVTVTINVTPVNDQPVAVNDNYVVAEDNTLTVNPPGILGNDVDVDGDGLEAVLITPPLHGTLNLDANGSFTYEPFEHYNGTDSFVYRAYDGTVNSNTATVTITVTPVNDIPEIVVMSAGPIRENELAIFMARIDDPDVGDTHEFTINWADGTAPETYKFGAGHNVISVSHRYLDDNPTATPSDVYTLNYFISDNNMGSFFGSHPLTVNNVAPQILNLVATENIQLGQVVTLTGSFVDPGTQDTWTMSINWGDGSAPQVINFLQPQAFTFNHKYPTPGNHTITVTVTDDDTGSDTEVAVTTVSASADLSILKTATPDPALTSEEITYMLLITNNGPSVATGVTVVDVMPASVEVIETVPECTEVSGTLVFDLGTLGPGQSTRVTIVGKLMQQGGITNVATVTGNEADPNLENNISTITTTVTFGPPPDGADITGQFVWINEPILKPTGKSRIKGNVMIVNRGTKMASRFVSRVYLSDDTDLDTSDTLIWTKKIRRMDIVRAHRFKFNGKVPAGIDPKGKYLILRMDEGDLVREIIETNNIVWAPLPFYGFPYPF